MSYFSLIYLGIFSLTISVLSFFNIIYSYYFNLYLNLNSYIYSLIISLILGLIFLLKNKDNYKISIYHKILTVISGYFILPLIISIPFYFSIYNISFLDSYFESISGFTSTGFSIFENVKHLDKRQKPVFEKPIYIEGEKDGVPVELSLRYNDSFSENRA